MLLPPLDPGDPLFPPDPTVIVNAVPGTIESLDSALELPPEFSPTTDER